MATASTIASSGINASTKSNERNKKMQKHWAILLLALMVASAVPALAADNPAPAQIDNERVTVWDTTSAIPAMKDDFVAISFAGGAAVFGHAGETAGHAGVRTIVIDLKNHPVPPLANNSGFPNAYPRPHIEKLLENDRVIVWRYRWNPGEPTPVHFHDKDVVVLYLEDSPLQSIEPNGKVTLNEYKSGDIRFNKRDRVHSELLAHDAASAVITELK
jgi:hypothetical protein